MPIIVQDLVKQYGEQLAVDHISFEAKHGQITGFLGPNGAGKSTTMKIAAGYLAATAGEIEINGEKVSENPFCAKRNVGYLPEHNPLYLDMYVREFLMFVGAAYKIKSSDLKGRIKGLVDQVGLAREQHKKIKALSKGYRQRVGLAQALLPDPPVLILDEPTTGLDPNQLVEIRKLIKEVATDKTVILSTHIMQEVEAICDHVVIINNGQIVADDSLQHLSGRATQANQWVVTFEQDVDITILENLPDVSTVTALGAGQYQVLASDERCKNAILKVAGEKELPLVSVKASGGSLEEIFHSLTQ